MNMTTKSPDNEPLYEKKCEACSIGTLPLEYEEIDSLAKELSSEWSVEQQRLIRRTFKFKNFKEALAFVNKVGDVAESEGHHPDIQLGWGRVEITLSTHKIHGLSLYDFIMASKFDQLY